MNNTAQLEALLLRHSGELLLAVDPASLSILAINPTCGVRLGYAPGQLVGKRITDVDVSLAGAVYWSEAAGGPAQSIESVDSQYRCADGSHIEVVQSIFVESGQDASILAIRARESVARAPGADPAADFTAQLRSILEATADGILVLDQAGRIVNMNYRFASLWELPENLESQGRGEEILAFMAARLADPAAYQKRLAWINALGDEETHDVLRLSTGRTLEQRSRPHDVAGQRRGRVFSYADVTGRAQSEQTLRGDRDHLVGMVIEQMADLRRAKVAAESANRAKSDFLSNMSHEMRTPMHAILSFARIGESRFDTSAPEKLRSYFGRIVVAAERLLVLLNDLLDLSKSEAGKLSLNLQAHDLRKLVQEAASEFSMLAEAKRIRLDFDLPGHETLAQVDALRFGQVVRNLLSNAVKFTPAAGRIVIRLAEASEPSAPAGLCLEVIDSGVGIPADQLELIFDKFVQSSLTRAGSGGTALGLAICREIMRAHKGTVSARNNPDGGAAFRIFLPRRQSVEVA